MADDMRVELVTGSPESSLAASLRDLAAEAEAYDGAPPFSEQTLVELGKGRPEAGATDVTVAFAEEGEELIGAGIVVHTRHAREEETLTELTVHPKHRRRRVGTRLAALLAESVLVPREGSTHRAWAHGGHAAGPKLAAAFGWVPVRELWRMRLDNDVELPGVDLDEGAALSTFRVGTDEQTWLQTNARAFSDHPEQGQLTIEDLEARKAEPWFDPSGFLMAWSDTDADSAELLGFHWTKIHPAQPPGSRPLGEVYVVGVAPSAQGRGLGASLTVAGIKYLRSQGVEAVMLYVDADNEAAVRLYKRLGFQVWDTDVQYAPSAGNPGGSDQAPTG